MANITDASVILIQNTTKGYAFPDTSQMNFPIVKINGSYSNFTKVISEVNNGSTYVVENVVDNQTLVFSNFSNESCFSFQDYVWIDRRLAPSDPNAYDNFAGTNQSGAYYDFGRIVAWEMIWRWAPRCKGLILSDFTDTHFMTHSVSDWKWHSPRSYNDRWWMPTFSVNKTIGNYLINHLDTATVTGFIDQEYRQQTNDALVVINLKNKWEKNSFF